MVGWPLYDQRRYDEALAQFDGVLAMNPDYMLANYNKALVYILLEMPEEVLVSAGNVAKSSGEDAHEVRLLMASAHALEGKNESALEILAEVERDSGKFSASWVARVHLLLGNEEEALSRLEKGFEMRSPGLIATSEPQFDVVRDHPRFQALRRKMGLP